jgi:hypothetical protein
MRRVRGLQSGKFGEFVVFLFRGGSGGGRWVSDCDKDGDDLSDGFGGGGCSNSE